jgi:CheY-like chemotaxis protein
MRVVESHPPPQAPPDRPFTALVVDDRVADQDLHCLLLQRWGMRTIAAADGWEALAYTRTVQPDVVVADLGMPRLDGWALLARLRAAPETARIPVVLVTAHASDAATAERAHAAGAAAVLGKPLDVTALQAALAQALGSARRDGTP